MIHQSLKYLLNYNSTSGLAGFGIQSNNKNTFYLQQNSSGDAILENNEKNRNISFYQKGDDNTTIAFNFNTTDSDTSRMVILNNGNVGFGTTTPSKKLDVKGDINFTGDLYQNGSLFSGSDGLYLEVTFIIIMEMWDLEQHHHRKN